VNTQTRKKISDTLVHCHQVLSEINKDTSDIHTSLRSLDMIVSSSGPVIGYQPKSFAWYELIDEHLYTKLTNDYGKKKSKEVMSRMFDPRLLWTLDKLRDRFGTTYINTWHSMFRQVTDKPRNWAGFRPHDGPYAELSQHRFGRAADPIWNTISAQEVREIIIQERDNPDWQYITEIEMTLFGKPISWFHFAVANNPGELKLLHV
jgi:hypothetical protein